VPSAARVREIVSLVPPAFVVLSGDDASARAVIQAGARGVISVTANVAPRAMADMIAAALRGDATAAAQLDAGLAPLHENLFLEANPIPAKWALARMGLMGAGLRLPLTELAAQFRPDLERALRQAGALR
jgi:4-hydroxy-tetrahydrodipicolinate synthase